MQLSSKGMISILILNKYSIFIVPTDYQFLANQGG
jgi:hypothetical protein